MKQVSETLQITRHLFSPPPVNPGQTFSASTWKMALRTPVEAGGRVENCFVSLARRRRVVGSKISNHLLKLLHEKRRHGRNGKVFRLVLCWQLVRRHRKPKSSITTCLPPFVTGMFRAVMWLGCVAICRLLVLFPAAVWILLSSSPLTAHVNQSHGDFYYNHCSKLFFAELFPYQYFFIIPIFFSTKACSTN